MKIGYSMPPGASLYPQPPYHYLNNRLVSLVFQTDPARLAELVPSPLVPDEKSLALFYIGEIQQVEPLHLSYREAGLGIPVLFDEQPMIYYPCQYVDNPLAMLSGREIWGFPRTLAEITFYEEDGAITASLSAGEEMLSRLAYTTTRLVDLLPALPAHSGVTLKAIPSAEKTTRPEVCQLCTVDMPSHLLTLEAGNASLTLSETMPPFSHLPVWEVVQAELSVFDQVIERGEVIWNYLHQNQPGLDEKHIWGP
jgi:acetoacetate decarboxylase